MWVLIIVMGFYGEAITVLNQEFSSKETCMTAQSSVLKQTDVAQGVFIKVKLCVPK